MIYLDHMASTPIDPRVIEVYAQAMLRYVANPNSAIHVAGVEANQAYLEALARIGDLYEREPDQVLLTSGASSALNVAVADAVEVAGGRPARIVYSAAEHPALLGAIREAQEKGDAEAIELPVDRNAVPDFEVLQRLASRADLICLMAANNELGTITPISAAVEVCQRSGARLLVDASQAAVWLDPSEFASVDYLVLSGLKAYGPRRVGALLGALHPRTLGAAVRFFGTPDVAGACAMAEALSLRHELRGVASAHVAMLRDRLQRLLFEVVDGLTLTAEGAPRLPGALHITQSKLPGDAVVARLRATVALSTGSACQSGAWGGSHVLQAIGLSDELAEGALRIGVGLFTTMDEIEQSSALIAAALHPDGLRSAA